MKDSRTAVIAVLWVIAFAMTLAVFYLGYRIPSNPAQAWTLYLEQRELEAQRHSEAMGGSK